MSYNKCQYLHILTGMGVARGYTRSLSGGAGVLGGGRVGRRSNIRSGPVVRDADVSTTIELLLRKDFRNFDYFLEC